MTRKIIDLTVPIETDHFRWPVQRKTIRSHAAGDIAEVTWVGWPVHGFTHMDSGRHFSPDAYTTDDIALDQTVGDAAVLDLSRIADDSPIGEEMVAGAGGHVREGDIVIMSSRWDERRSLQNPEFWTDAPYMTVEACRWLHARGIKAIAFDFPQDRCIRDLVTGERTPALEENTTHVELLLKGVPMFEYLCNTGAVSAERVAFYGLPLKLPHCDGAPARVIAIEEG